MSRRLNIVPKIDNKITKSLNLTVLQRTDRCIEEILLTATHVCLYRLDTDAHKWSRENVEGSLFVVKRNAQPQFQFIVMNRCSTDNRIENLVGNFEYEVQLPYLLYRNDAKEVIGIWFYDSRECEAVAHYFNRILNEYSKVPPKPKVMQGKSEFEKTQAVPSMAMAEGPLETLTSNYEGPLEPLKTNLEVPPEALKTNPTRTTVREDSTLMSILSAVMKIGGDSSTAANSTQVCSSLQTIPSPAQVPNVVPSPRGTPQNPLLHLLPSFPSTPLYEAPYPINNGNLIPNLVTPASLSVPPPTPYPLIKAPYSSTRQLSTVHNPALSLQHGAPLLQPFPPPTPPPLLTSNTPRKTEFEISKADVKNALLMLVKDDRFVGVIYQALLMARQL